MIDKAFTERFARFLRRQGRDVTLRDDGTIFVPHGAENGEDIIVYVEREVSDDRARP